MGGEAQLWISMQLAEQIRRHGAETYPHECCGALLGRDNPVSAHSSSDEGAEKPQREVLALFPLVNRRDDSPRNRFSVTSGDVRAAEKEAARQGIDVIGWYHSHPDHPARPREYDREHAWPRARLLIVTVAGGPTTAKTSLRPVQLHPET